MNLALPTARFAKVWTPPPPGNQATDNVDFDLSVGGVRHIDDPKGLGRRYIEGWVSLTGIDMQAHEMAADACQKGAEKYLKRNPVIVWHHKAELPIGKVETLTFDDRGMYMTGYIFRMSEVLEEWKAHKEDIPLDSIALKCEEVWEGIKQGYFGSFSFRGGVREVAPVWSDELQRVIPRFLEVELYELTISPIGIHPGAKITRINTVAKAFGEALEICKALDYQPQSTTPKGETMDLSKQWEAFQATLIANADENGNVELPDEISKGLQELGFEAKEPEVVKTPEQLVAEQAEVIKSLQERLDSMESGGSGAPAARRGHATVNAPEDAKVKPTGATGEGAGKVNVLSKCLTDASTTYRRRTNFGEGSAFLPAPPDVYKSALVEAENQGFMKCGKVNFSRNFNQYVRENING